MAYTYSEKASLDLQDIQFIEELEKVCFDFEDTHVKLELDYKKQTVSLDQDINNHRQMNEFLCFDDTLLIGYLGVCDFAGSSIELNGLVHPLYRRESVFTSLFSMFLKSMETRKEQVVLLLSDAKSKSGEGFIHNFSVKLHHSEYEMYLDEKTPLSESNCEVELRLATNKDAYEIDQQNRSYFGVGDSEDIILNHVNPEEEIEKGFYIYLAICENKIVGKVNVQYGADISGIYGLGVKPEFRSKGIGRSILLKTIDEMKEKSASQVMLQVEIDNKNALKLYESCGFKTTYVMNYYQWLGSKK